MNFLNKLERKFGRYAIRNLMSYIVMLNIAGVVIDLISPGLYENFLTLDIGAVLDGQVWRLVTFLITPPSTVTFFTIIEIYLYYSIGNSLENAWGPFRFNMYYLSGILFNILASSIIYAATGMPISFGLTYINRSMFFAFAALYPNVQFLLMYLIPIKVKYLAYAYGILYIYDIIRYLRIPVLIYKFYGVGILVALLNFIIFFFATRNYKRYSPNEYRRKAKYRKEVKNHAYGNVVDFNGKKVISRHKCAVCGRTELDDDSLEFRFCSKCDGNYEYCMDHLFTHEHVKNK